MIPSKTFIYFIRNRVTGHCYYIDATDSVQLVNPLSVLFPVNLKHAPGNWIDTTIAFDRNLFYLGLNRSYSTPMEFVLDAKKIIETLTLNGYGVEEALELIVFKLNTVPQAGEPTYKKYYCANIDLPNTQTVVLETLTTNLMEGGVMQLLKNYENTVLEIPCDGSLPEHFKANCDGMLVRDRLFYEFVPTVLNFAGTVVDAMPTTFVNNENDNYGIVHGNQSYARPGTFVLQDTNYTFYSDQQITIRIKGAITLRSTDQADIARLDIVGLKSTHTGGALDYLVQTGDFVTDATFYFDKHFTLAAYEKFLIYVQPSAGSGGFTDVNIISGNFSIEFASKAKPSRPWGLTAYDLWKLMGKEICRLSSSTNQVFTYAFESDLLQQYLQLFCTCGDALRASNDPNYQRYFSINENAQTNFGIVYKITLKQFYQAIKLPTFACITKGGGTETLLFERLDSVFDSSLVDYSLGEVARLKYELHSKEFIVSDLNVGWKSKDNDQQSGKYDWNTTAKYKMPIISTSKTLDLTSDMVWSAQVIERLRANNDAGAQTSSTRNNNDNSFCGLVINRSVWIQDYFRALFVSLISTGPDNTNIHFANDQNFQPYDMPIKDGGDFLAKKDFGIFVFAEDGYSATEAIVLTIDATINSVNRPASAPVDTINIVFWHNGVAIRTYNFPVTGINTPVNITDIFSVPLQEGDVIYVTADTSAYCEATINTILVIVGAAYVTMSGANIPIQSGLFKQVISMPNVTPSSSPFVEGTSVVQTGFQYFQYNSLAYAHNFDIQLGVVGFKDGSTNNFEFDVFLNGQQFGAQTIITGSVPQLTFAQSTPVVNRDLALGDIIFVTGRKLSPSGGLNVQLVTSTLTFTNTYVKAYSLLRVNYDNVSGIPLLTSDGRWDSPGAPFNIEYVTPRRILDLWISYINSNFFDRVTGLMKFNSLDKNPYLSTTQGLVTITENSDKILLTGGRLFYPTIFEVDFKCPLTFAEMQQQLINAHLHVSYYGHDIYGHVLHIEQKPALNATTTARLLLSPLSDLSIFSTLAPFKIPDMAANTIKYDFLNPVQDVPINQTQPNKYKTFNRNYFLFKQQVGGWLQQDGYCQPVQIGDLITRQYITRDLDPIFYTIWDCKTNKIYRGPTNYDTIATNSLQSVDPLVRLVLWQKYIDTTDWDEGEYYCVTSSAAGDLLISECLDVRRDWPDTVLVEFTSSQNIGTMVFISESPFRGSMRIKALFDNQFKQKYTGKFYIDQPADITVLNAIPHETTTLFIEGDAGVPDYVAKKVLRMLLLDGCTLDGEGFTLNEGAEMEEIFTVGAPKKFYKIELRPTNNITSIDVTAGEIDRDISLMVVFDQMQLGPNDMNESGSDDPVLVEIPITP